MALVTCIVSRVVSRALFRRLGVASALAGGLLALSIAIAREPEARRSLAGVGNRYETAALLPRLPADGAFSFLVIGGDGVGVADAVARGLEAVPGAAFAILAGDLVTSPDPKGYDLLLDRIASIPARPAVFCLRGRHEAGTDGARSFAERFGHGVFHIMYGDALLLFLDNADGEVSKSQIDAFDRLLEVHGSRWSRIFAFVQRPSGPDGEPLLADFCRRHAVDAVIVGRAEASHRERRSRTDWISIGPAGATAIAFGIDSSGALTERVVAEGVGRGWLARATHAWAAKVSPWIASRRVVLFLAAAVLLVGGLAVRVAAPLATRAGRPAA